MANNTLLLDQAAILDIVTKKGDAINTSITVYDGNGNIIDFSIYANARLQVKRDSEDNTNVLEWSKSRGQILLFSNGKIEFHVDGSVMDVDSGNYVYDMEVYNSSSDRKTIIKGLFAVNDDVTSD